MVNRPTTRALRWLSPGPGSRGALLVTNALPLVPLLTGQWRAGDVLVAYWLESLVVFAVAVIQMGTARSWHLHRRVPDLYNGWPRHSGRLTTQPDGVTWWYPTEGDRLAAVTYTAFALMLIAPGQGIAIFDIAAVTGRTGSPVSYLAMLASMALTYAFTMHRDWFRRRGRDRVSMITASRVILSRWAIAHATVYASGYLILHASKGGRLDWVPGAVTVGPAVLLVVIKTTVELLQRRRDRASGVATPTTS